jgi:hypothetical protein
MTEVIAVVDYYCPEVITFRTYDKRSVMNN